MTLSVYIKLYQIFTFVLDLRLPRHFLVEKMNHIFGKNSPSSKKFVNAPNFDFFQNFGGFTYKSHFFQIDCEYLGKKPRNLWARNRRHF